MVAVNLLALHLKADNVMNHHSFEHHCCVLQRRHAIALAVLCRLSNMQLTDSNQQFIL